MSHSRQAHNLRCSAPSPHTHLDGLVRAPGQLQRDVHAPSLVGHAPVSLWQGVAETMGAKSTNASAGHPLCSACCSAPPGYTHCLPINTALTCSEMPVEAASEMMATSCRWPGEQKKVSGLLSRGH